MKVQKLFAVSACSAILGLTSFAQAQQPVTRANQVQPGAPGQAVAQPRVGQVGQPTQWRNTDHVLASCMAIANQTEVTIAKKAEDKVSHKEVKEFARMLQKDHGNFLQKLRQFAPEATQEGYLSDRTESTASTNRALRAGGEVKNDNQQIQQTGATQAAGSEAGQPLDMVQLHREIAEECIHSATKKMDQKKDKELDECFIGFQIAAHAQMLDKLKVFKRHASGELVKLIDDGIETTEKHLKKAEEIMKDLAKSNHGDGSDKQKS